MTLKKALALISGVIFALRHHTPTAHTFFDLGNETLQLGLISGRAVRYNVGRGYAKEELSAPAHKSHRISILAPSRIASHLDAHWLGFCCQLSEICCDGTLRDGRRN
jgi:hypothetical protein